MRMGPDGSVPDSASFERYLTAEWNEFQAEISPDGRYVAYVSDQEGEERVYVHTFPVPTGIRPVSASAGTDPRWAPNGGTLYYRNGTTFYAVDVTTDPSFSVGPPRELFDYPTYAVGIGGSVVPHYDVHPDGDRFILTEQEGAAPEAGQGGEEILTADQRLQDVYLVANWFTELKALMGN
jgi:serine/threonine-protein kinase